MLNYACEYLVSFEFKLSLTGYRLFLYPFRNNFTLSIGLVVIATITFAFVLLYAVYRFQIRARQYEYPDSFNSSIIVEYKAEYIEVPGPSHSDKQVFLSDRESEALKSIIQSYKYRYYSRLYPYFIGEKFYKIYINSSDDYQQLIVSDAGIITVDNIEVSISDSFDCEERRKENIELYYEIDEFYNNFSKSK